MVGPVAHAEVPGLVRRLDIAAAPYTDTGDFYFSPLKVMEYLAAGRAVVHPDLGELGTLVGDAGLAYPPGDVSALAERLERLIGDAGLRDRLGACARRRAQVHAWEHVAEKLVALTAPPAARVGHAVT